MTARPPTPTELVGTARQPNDGRGNIGTVYDILSTSDNTGGATLTVRDRPGSDTRTITYKASLFDWPVS